jgi:dolichol-phosphate mannosyltransferase
MKLISVVIPAFNEEENIPVLAARLVDIFATLPAYDYELLFVDDGSSDKSLEVLQTLHQENNKINYLSFSRNFGHQNALKCGLYYAKGDCAISMDADMQHPPALLPSFIEKWEEGYEIVYTQREADKNLSFFKNKTSSLFYKIIDKLSDVTLEEGTADFRLLDKKVLNVINNLKENDLFIRGMIAWIGFKQFKIKYTPDKRFAGTTKYSFSKMLKLAVTGITAFSIKPLKVALLMGIAISIFAFIYAMYAVAMYFFTDETVPGWTSVLVSVLLIGGLQLMTLGIIGEYLGRLFMQAKYRPDFIVRESSVDKP